MTRSRRLGLAIVLGVFLSDQASKLWLLFGARLAENGPFSITPFMDIVLAWNRGVSYGLFQQDGEIGRWALVAISIVASIWLSRWMWREPRLVTVASLALIIGGALGNAVDRAVYGAVVDFVHLHYGDYGWYIFNVADVAIVVGVAGLLYESLPSRADKAA